MIKTLIKKLLSKLFVLCPVNPKVIVFESEGDLSDNSYALFDYMNSKGLDYKYVWLVRDLNQKNNKYHAVYSAKGGIRGILKTIYYLSVCKYYIYDHCNYFEALFIKKKKGQTIVNLWHGCGFKAAPFAEKESNIDFIFTTSEFFNSFFSKLFGVKQDKIAGLGYPRTDYFYKALNAEQNKQKKLYEKFDKVFLWMPTFRRSNSKEIDEAYFNSYTGLPVLTDEQSLSELDSYLKSVNSLCIFKIHHLQADLPSFKKHYSNIEVIDDRIVKERGMQLYEFISLTDCLITDYSSVSTDYMLLDKPIIYTLDDYNEYEASRGFLIDNCIEYFAGLRVVDKEGLLKAIEEVVQGQDSTSEERRRVNNLLNDNHDGRSCERILKAIGI